MKKNLLIIILALVIILAFVSCDNSKDMKSKTSSTIYNTTISNTTSRKDESMREKLNQIQKGWTIDQVKELLGKPDEVIGGGTFDTLLYNLNNKEKVYITYSVFNDEGKNPHVTIENTETGETTTILE